MGFKKFSWLIIFRTILTIITVIILTQVLVKDGYHITSIMLLLLLVTQLAELVNFVSKTNAELVRFFDAVRYADFSQRFELKHVGSGFDEMGKAFNDILARMQASRRHQEHEIKHLKALIEHVPVPLISIHQNEQITLWNNSARRLFGSHNVTKLEDLTQFGQYFSEQLKALPIGKRDLINIIIDGQEHRLSISATQVVSANSTETLLSLQDIQSELDLAQLQAWQDLVRVLTHEIMNSITPVASLAKTATDIVEEVRNNSQLPQQINEDLDDVSQAVATVARRSEGLMKFVSSYRRLTRLPKLNKKLIKVSTLIQQVQALACQDWHEKGISLDVNIDPPTLDISVDINMVEQVLLNLLQNAEQAFINQNTNNKITNQAKVMISVFLNLRGRVVIDVSNNGPIIPEEIAKEVFVPFYTTKIEGSGVGLALSRQIMLAHQGSILLRNNNDITTRADTENKVEQHDSKGVTFSLTF
ncbi:sensor histidine kinase [Cognaticolwellia mytili]|uniref:sensor histidine kinase n=1 Tax=Cognaticolwellia mytili TaxID=1888913 RepID=UPI000A170E51|nr:ATP-binding protein [Cognaticolwellia mytili]